MPSRIKKLGLPLLMLLWAFCSGCFTGAVDSFCDRCHEDVHILERRCEWSEDGKTLAVYCRKRIDYCYDPFRLFAGSKEESTTHIYSLTTPGPDDKLCCWLLVPTTQKRQLRVGYDSYDFLEVKEGKEFEPEQLLRNKVDYNHLLLPSIQPPSYQWAENLPETYSVIVHPDDLPLFQKPFLVSRGGCFLVIPYKIEENVCWFYVPKDQFFSGTDHYNISTTSQSVFKTLLMPPAIVLDVITSPIQFCIFITYFISNFPKSLYPYP